MGPTRGMKPGVEIPLLYLSQKQRLHWPYVKVRSDGLMSVRVFATNAFFAIFISNSVIDGMEHVLFAWEQCISCRSLNKEGSAVVSASYLLIELTNSVYVTKTLTDELRCVFPDLQIIDNFFVIMVMR